MLKRLGAALVALLFFACSRPAEKPATDAGQGRASARAGVKVPLPEGWHAEVGADQSFRAGPAGRVVLRVDLRPGSGGDFPSTDQLELAFTSGLKDTRVVRESSVEDADYAAVRLELARVADGGSATPHDVYLGARRVGNDLFLCATEPGASEAELDLAAKACRDLSYSAAP